MSEEPLDSATATIIFEAIDNVTAIANQVAKVIEGTAKRIEGIAKEMEKAYVATQKVSYVLAQESQKMESFIKRYETAFIFIAGAATGTMAWVIRSTPVLTAYVNEATAAFEVLGNEIGTELIPDFEWGLDVLWGIVDWYIAAEPAIKKIIAYMIEMAGTFAGIGGAIGKWTGFGAWKGAAFGAVFGGYVGFIRALREILGIDKMVNELLEEHFPALARWLEMLNKLADEFYNTLKNILSAITNIELPPIPMWPFMGSVSGAATQTLNMNLWIPNVNLRVSEGESIEDFAEKLVDKIKRGMT